MIKKKPEIFTSSIQNRLRLNKQASTLFNNPDKDRLTIIDLGEDVPIIDDRFYLACNYTVCNELIGSPIYKTYEFAISEKVYCAILTFNYDNKIKSYTELVKLGLGTFKQRGYYTNIFVPLIKIKFDILKISTSTFNIVDSQNNTAESVFKLTNFQMIKL